MNRFRLTAAGLVLAAVCLCGGCAAKSGKALLVRTLYEPYEAEIQFSFAGEEPLCGTATLVRGEETLQVTLTSPEPYTGLGVSTDTGGSDPVFTLSFSGVKAAVPREALSKLASLAAFFEDGTAKAAEDAPRGAFAPYERPDGVTAGEYAVTFKADEREITLVYEPETGRPLAAWDGTTDVRFIKFKTKET